MWFFVQLCSSWQDFNWLKASRGPSVIAELLVKIQDGGFRDLEKSKSWKIEKWPYHSNGLTELREIWHGDAFWPSWPFPTPIFPTFENPRWRGRHHEKWKNRQISATVQPIAVKFGVVTHFCPSWPFRPITAKFCTVTHIGTLTHIFLPAVKNSTFQISKMAHGGHLNN